MNGRPLNGLFLLLVAALLTIHCSPEDPEARGPDCPSRATFDEALQRCVLDDNASDNKTGGIDNQEAATDTGVPDDTGSPTGPSDTGSQGSPVDDAGQHSDTELSQDTGAPENDAGSPENDAGSPENDAGSPENDAGSPEQDTGSDPGPQEPVNCGGDAWDGVHDDTNPWDPFTIDCDDLDVSWDCGATAEELELIELINEMRSEVRVCGGQEMGPSDPVTLSPGLQCAARIHTWDMIERGYWGHDTLEGIGIRGRTNQIGGFSWMAIGENITNNSTAEAAIQSWMNSAGHCRNIMCEHFSLAGGGTYGGRFTMKVAGSGLCS